MASPLIELPLDLRPTALPAQAEALVREGLARSRAIRCFDFVPSDPTFVHAALRGLAIGRFCEWGSGIGIGVGLATLLGFESRGVEIDPALAEASRRLLSDFGLRARIETGDYLARADVADVYLNYSWPQEMRAVEAHFLAVAPDHACLLMCHGAQDLRHKRKPPA